jgi:hypothetical protein
MELKRDKIILLELDENELTEVDKKNGVQKGKGYRVHAVYDGSSNPIATYDGKLNRTDLDALEKLPEDTVVVLVSGVRNPDPDPFVWRRYSLSGSFIKNDGGQIQFAGLVNGRECDEAETAYLDFVFPRYRARAFAPAKS